MRKTVVLIAAVAAALLLGPSPRAHAAQISVQIGPAPVCPYGYYSFPPYNCAPYGYYGPDWFSGGIFIGAGPWFHGPHDFHGWVNNRYAYGHYHGAYPRRGDHDDWQGDHFHGHPEGYHGFHGNEMRDGRGHVMHGGHPH